MSVVGLIGAGVMGKAAASRLLLSGFSVVAFDPSVEAQEHLRNFGAGVAGDILGVVDQSDVILMFLPEPHHVRSAVIGTGGVLAGSCSGKLLVDMSTVDPETSEEIWVKARECGVGYLDAPVLGRPSSVGKWALPVGGDAEDIERCRPILTVLADRLFHIGSSGAGNKLKLLNQLLFSAINAMTAEMMAVATKIGIPPKVLYETITSSQAGTVSNLFRELGANIVADNYAQPTFSVDLLCKDVRLAIEMAQRYGAPPLLACTTQFINEMAQSQGLGKQDTAVMWKSLIRMWETMAQIDDAGPLPTAKPETVSRLGANDERD